MGSPASFTFTPDYIKSLPQNGPIHYLVKPGIIDIGYTDSDGRPWLKCTLCRYIMQYCSCRPYPPPAPFPFKDTDYGKASSSWKATQEAINKAERKEKKARKARKLERAPTLCLTCGNSPCSCPMFEWSEAQDDKDSRPERETEVQEMSFCDICKINNCDIAHDWSDHLLQPDLGGAQDMQDIEPEGKEAKATPASVKKLRKATLDKIESHHKEWQDLNADEEPALRGEKPKTLTTNCIVCNKTTQYNPEYQTPEKTTCSDVCFLKDYDKNQEKLVQLLDDCAKADLAPDKWWKLTLAQLWQ